MKISTLVAGYAPAGCFSQHSNYSLYRKIEEVTKMSNIIYSFCEMTDKAMCWTCTEEYSPQEEHSLSSLFFSIVFWLFIPVFIPAAIIIRVIAFLSKVKFRKQL